MIRLIPSQFSLRVLDISLLNIESGTESKVSKDTVLAITSQDEDTDSQDSEITILAIVSETDTEDSTALTPVQDVPDY